MNATPFLPTSPATPVLFPAAAPASSLADKPDWELVVERLPVIDPVCEFYTLRDIAPLLGNVTPVQLSDHAKDLWPKYEGHYRLDRDLAVKLIKRYLRVGRLKFQRAELERLWHEAQGKKPIFN